MPWKVIKDIKFPNTVIVARNVENKDSTDGIIDTITEIFQPILDEFEDLNEENED